jgi:hypothetical protein
MDSGSRRDLRTAAHASGPARSSPRSRHCPQSCPSHAAAFPELLIRDSEEDPCGREGGCPSNGALAKPCRMTTCWSVADAPRGGGR